MSKNEQPEHLEISSYFKDEYLTTEELKKLDLYYTINDDLSVKVYIKLKSGILKPKTIHVSAKDVRYINHRGANYSINSIIGHVLVNDPLEKGISKKFTHRTHRKRDRRTPKISFLSRVISFLRGW